MLPIKGLAMLANKPSSENGQGGERLTRDIIEANVARWVLHVEHPYIRGPVRYWRKVIPMLAMEWGEEDGKRTRCQEGTTGIQAGVSGQRVSRATAVSTT